MNDKSYFRVISFKSLNCYYEGLILNLFSDEVIKVGFTYYMQFLNPSPKFLEPKFCCKGLIILIVKSYLNVLYKSILILYICREKETQLCRLLGVCV